MIIKRSTIFFLSTCTIAFIFILYVLTDLRIQTPSVKYAMLELNNKKWAALKSELRTIENELNQHQAIVEEIKHTMEQIIEHEFQPPLRIRKKINMSCPAIQTSAKTDVQMLSMYDRIMFDDINGGVWKQGWNIEYKDSQWSSKNKLKVFIVPHSHNDPGWIQTFENYYKTRTKEIFTNMVKKLNEDVGRKFIWAETSYLAFWWTSDATEQEKLTFQKLLKTGQIEIVTGGWVMNDEANSHWVSIAHQLTTGHQWLIDNLGYIPKNAWSIDAFGYSSTQAYLLKLTGLENSVIQRVHYRVKKELSINRQLEFKWRQLWDGVGKTDMFTHLMPFYSYDIPHTCGPDPKVCCQFDFKRLPGIGPICPWGIRPSRITPNNVNERSNTILDQWRKKAQLYRSNVVMIQLGDDFMYERAKEWDSQYSNYEMLINHINGMDSWNTEVQFGTLEDYFKAVHEEVKLSDFPVLSGDFFAYADRDQHYWSGYYTSRPFYKSMDRILLAYVRAAETITTQVSSSVSALVALQLRERTDSARRALALFQHHDGVTGTERDAVREDYAKKMFKAIKHSQSVIQQAAYHLLKQPAIRNQTQEDVYFEVDDIWRRHDEIPTRITIALDVLSPSRRIVLYNALPFRRYEIFTVIVSSPHVEVFNAEGSPMSSQVSPVVTGERRLGFASNKFQLSFPVSVRALGLAVYTVRLKDSVTINKYTSYAHVRIYNADWSAELPRVFAVEQPSGRLVDDITLSTNTTSLVVTRKGLLKAIVSEDGRTTPVHMNYVKYDTQKDEDNNSGAYLFMPSGPATEFNMDPYPEILVIEGHYKATVYTGLIGPREAEIVLTMSVYTNPSLKHSEVEVVNTFLLDWAARDIELAVRLNTNIRNGDTFYTDLNGMQMIKRRYFNKLPLQANFYPLPAAAFLEDDNTRLTVLTSAPLGTAALQPGQIEIIQDRRLSRDDNRGLAQGLQDNVRTRHALRLVLEHAPPGCASNSLERTSAHLTLGAHVSQQMLLQPLVALHYSPAESAAPPAPPAAPLAPPAHSPATADLVLAACRSHVTTKNKDGTLLHGMGMTLQRVHLDTCYGNDTINKWYPVGDGQISIIDLLDVQPDKVFDSSLTFVHMRDPVPEAIVTLCPMEVRSVFINQTFKQT